MLSVYRHTLKKLGKFGNILFESNLKRMPGYSGVGDIVMLMTLLIVILIPICSYVGGKVIISDTFPI